MFGIILSPYLFQIIEAAHFGTEQMDDDVAKVEQDPVSIWQTLDLWRMADTGLDLLCQMVSHRADMPRRPARGQDHDVGNRGLAYQIYRFEVFSLVIFQCCDEVFR